MRASVSSRTRSITASTTHFRGDGRIAVAACADHQLVLEIFLHDRLAGRWIVAPEAVRAADRAPAAESLDLGADAVTTRRRSRVRTAATRWSRSAGYEENRRILIEGCPRRSWTPSCPPDGALYLYATSRIHRRQPFLHQADARGGATLPATFGHRLDPIHGRSFVRFLLCTLEPADMRERFSASRAGSSDEACRGYATLPEAWALPDLAAWDLCTDIVAVIGPGIEKLPSSYIRRAAGHRGSSERHGRSRRGAEGAVHSSVENCFVAALCLFARRVWLDRNVIPWPLRRGEIIADRRGQQGRALQLRRRFGDRPRRHIEAGAIVANYRNERATKDN